MAAERAGGALPRLHDRAALLLLLASSVGILVLLLSGGNELRPGALDNDVTNHFHIWADFIHRWLQRGVIPWWNPHSFHGYPALETMQTGLGYPVSLFLLYLFPAGLALNLLTAFHILLAVWGMAWFGRQLGISRFPAAVMALVYALSGVVAVRVTAGHVTVVGVLGWWPWALGGWVQAWSVIRRTNQGNWSWLLALVRMHQRARLGLLVAIGSTTMAVLAGAPQYVAYLGYGMLVLGLGDLVIRRGFIRAPLPRLILLGVALGLVWIPAVGLSAPLWLPSLAYLPFSSRGESGAMAGSLALGEDVSFAWLETFMAFPLGDDVLSPHLGRSNVWETSTYYGVAPLALTAGLMLVATVARWRGQRITLCRVLRILIPSVALLVLFAILMQDLPLPGLSRFRDPLKARALAGFALCLGLGGGLTLWLRLRQSPLRRWLVVGSVLPAIPIGMWFLRGWLDPESLGSTILPAMGPFDLLAAQEYALHKAYPHLAGHRLALGATRSLLCLGVLVVLLVLVSRLVRHGSLHGPSRMALMVLPGLVALADALPPHLVALLPNQPYAATMPSAAVRRTLESVERQITDTGRPFRVTLPSILMNRGAYFDHIYDTGGYDPLMPRDTNNRSVTGELAMLAKRIGHADAAAEERRALVSKTLGRRYDWGATRSARGTGAFARDWPRFNAVEGWMMANAPEAAIIELTRNATTTKSTEMPFGPDGTGAHLLHDGPESFPRYEGEVLANPRAEAVLADIGATAGDESDDPKSSWRVRDGDAPHVITVELDPPVSETTVLIARVTHLPGWSVRVDDGPSQHPLLANGWMLAAALPAGTQKVEFRYFPKYLLIAPWITVGTLVGLGLLLGWRRRNGEPSQRPLQFGPTKT